MSWRLSTALRNAMLETDSLKDILAGGVIKVFTGTQPSSADDEESGTHLLTLTVDGETVTSGDPTNGLNLGDASEGKIQKASGETWKGENLESGTAGWFRWYPNDFANHEGEDMDETKIRLDGRCASTGGELNFTSTSLTQGVDTTVSTAELIMPAS